MYEKIELQKLSDIFVPLGSRARKGTFFVRTCTRGQETDLFLSRYVPLARKSGAVIEGALGNPDQVQTNEFIKTLGNDFAPDKAFIYNGISRWMPDAGEAVKTDITDALSQLLWVLKTEGKSESVLKNFYIKVFIWLRNRFAQTILHLNAEEAPGVLLVNSFVTAHEVYMLTLLCRIGADVFLVQPQGDDLYLKADPQGRFSCLHRDGDALTFDKAFSVNKMLSDEKEASPCGTEEKKEKAAPRLVLGSSDGNSPYRYTGERPKAELKLCAESLIPSIPDGVADSAPKERPAENMAAPAHPAAVDERTWKRLDARFPRPERYLCINAWMKKPEWRLVLQKQEERGNNTQFIYTAFLRVMGTNARGTYANDLYRFYQDLLLTRREILVLDGEIVLPGAEQVARIKHGYHHTVEDMILDLAGNIPPHAKLELQQSMLRAFMEVMLQEAQSEQKLNRLTNSAVYLLALLKRYYGDLFTTWRPDKIPCVIKMHGCRSKIAALFMRFLSRLPLDIVIFEPELGGNCVLKTDKLLEISGTDSVKLARFPGSDRMLKMQTVASRAENELTGMLYQDGVYRDRQMTGADTIVLETTFDELFILWDQELRFRPNFSTVNGRVNMPVINAKVSGVDSGKILPYWQKIKSMITHETILIQHLPVADKSWAEQFRALSVRVIKNGRLLREELCKNRLYPFNLLREQMQMHILDKLQLMLDEKLIHGMGENGMEYNVIANVLAMPRNVIRILQQFDFTKKNPKLLIINADEVSASEEDAIVMTFLNMLGFDILQFVPTGYRTIEPYLKGRFPVEHQAGELMFTLTVPDFDKLQMPRRHDWLKFFIKEK